MQQPRSRWQQIRHWMIIVISVGAPLILIGVPCYAVIRHGWGWTGFVGGGGLITKTTTEHGIPVAVQSLPGKTLWDWMQLLLVPIILAIGGFLLNYFQKKREESATTHRDKLTHAIATDNQQQAALQSYIDKIGELLLREREHLGASLGNPQVENIARARTITVLRILDPARRVSLLRFLSQAGVLQLCTESNLVNIDLHETDLVQFALSNFKLFKANLTGADLTRAMLDHADLTGADLTGAKLEHADLTGANLTGAKFDRADLTGANLTGVKLEHADLSRAMNHLEANLARAKLLNAKLSRAKLSRAKLARANLLLEANLTRAKLDHANLTGADLTGAKLDHADLSGADLTRAWLFEANLTRAKLDYANLTEANLTRANLREADLSRANLTGVRFLEDTRLDKTVLHGVKGLRPEQLAHCKASGALFDQEATPSTPPSQSATAISSQEAVPQASPSPDQAIPSAHVQEVIPEATTSQKHTAVEKGDTNAKRSEDSPAQSDPLSQSGEGQIQSSPQLQIVEDSPSAEDAPSSPQQGGGGGIAPNGSIPPTQPNSAS